MLQQNVKQNLIKLSYSSEKKLLGTQLLMRKFVLIFNFPKMLPIPDSLGCRIFRSRYFTCEGVCKFEEAEANKDETGGRIAIKGCWVGCI